jgi:hypothetical protein
MFAESVDVQGRIVSVESKETVATGSNTRYYRPTVSYRDPSTGEERVAESENTRPSPLEVGEAISLVFDPNTSKVALPEVRSWRETVGVAAIGVFLILLGLFDLLR